MPHASARSSSPATQLIWLMNRNHFDYRYRNQFSNNWIQAGELESVHSCWDFFAEAPHIFKVDPERKLNVSREEFQECRDASLFV